jgi:general secretion pathway protein C
MEMKRLPLAAVFILFIALSASAAFWGMQLFKPAQRPVAAPPASRIDARPEAAASLFGGRLQGMTVASNFELLGVVASGTGKESIAIIAADGSPAEAKRVNSEVAPGVRIKEVHPKYVLLVENGVTKRVDLPESAKGQGNISMANTMRTPVPVQQPPQSVVGAPSSANNPVVVSGLPDDAQQQQQLLQQQQQLEQLQQQQQLMQQQQMGQTQQQIQQQQMQQQQMQQQQMQQYPNQVPGNDTMQEGGVYDPEMSQSRSAYANMPTDEPQQEQLPQSSGGQQFNPQ